MVCLFIPQCMLLMSDVGGRPQMMISAPIYGGALACQPLMRSAFDEMGHFLSSF